MRIEIHRRPTGPVAEEIFLIVTELTGEWFTADVAPATRRDLLFHDVVCAVQDERIRAFIMFTSHDGAIHITLMGTSPNSISAQRARENSRPSGDLPTSARI